MANVLWSYARLPLLATTGLVGVLSSALYYYQNEIIYPRNLPAGARTEVPVPTQFGLHSYDDLYLDTPDQEKLHAYLIRPSNSQHARNVTMLMFHGNAGNIGHRLPIAKVLSTDLGCNVLMLQYRGYGKSTGSPDEKGINVDAQTGLDYIRSRDDLKKTKIVIYGQSIGGAVGIRLTRQNLEMDIAGLILENTFLSITKLIPSVMPAAKFLSPLCHEKWASEADLPKIKEVPILFLSGLRDEIVPPAHMKQLYSICTAKTKVWRELPYGDHNNTVAESAYFHYIEDFLKIHVDSA
ncbi:alpha/beta hydrolase BEM46/Esterase/lipase/thioesterase [Myriangium duriaei CBS 260.36]|uniref:Alpha/beta hydrolase BEM46/Esterase/lipase/thioesterase n=1 Tax=Myriangium duriaei CBS 260.36 TaxID=1168546 RepID=A0A9P4J8E3_9PEZI|nr:alpha/beta hydrolase BEM46/Esterase/lipase/thioesterase [Myriangium duriaei CBS 260.36]